MLLKQGKKIFIVDSKEKWKEISTVVCRDVAAVNILGFDCEWVHTNGKRKPVALMQLATYSGYCVLIRLNCLQGDLPSTLQDILKDRKIIKVGVSCGMDASYLANDYGVNVGWICDIWLLKDNLKICSFGLQGLAEHYLCKTLNKDWKLRSADWEAQTLTQQQVIYASEDALVGAHILLAQLKNLWKPPPHSFSPAFFLGSWEASAREAITEICQPSHSRLDFHHKSSGSNVKSKKQIKTTNQKDNRLKNERMSYSIRKSPLYHNSQLWAPDGEPLCTCDPKKALWYVEKGLGDLISEEPLVVKLRFEPAGRPNREGLDGQFYLQERLNNCVVCGKEDSYIRKNVVPHEYRKYFPEILEVSSKSRCSFTMHSVS
ncbi:Exonuclease 3'-5' domain-containing protein 2 [Armadillidium nasatum]|uniref:Exonuclease 3'-5' domain-containing protein 2 n=1 Tax=Armadillidium nasatum TaxID=96803 RepID=A0A5N5SRM8_9CRUS|nr:Exonuclease 3'-5' domain-containing protein 2 [Armadillidium nasatum]